MSDNRRNYFLLHFIVFIWGWTAVLGKLITIPAVKLVWLRLPIALAGILAYLLIARKPLLTTPKNILLYFGVGLIVALHWVCFYGAVHESNVSITLACFSTASLFTAFIEPLFFRRRIRIYEILFCLMTGFAIFLINKGQAEFSLGIWMGVLAALTTAIFGVINGYLVRNGHDGAVISLYEMLGGFLGMTLFVLLARPWDGPLVDMSAENFAWLLTLGLVCTSLPFLVSLHILKTISPYTVSLTLNLEVIYGILFAFFIFNESAQLNIYFYTGAGIILATVFLNTWLKQKEK